MGKTLLRVLGLASLASAREVINGGVVDASNSIAAEARQKPVPKIGEWVEADDAVVVACTALISTTACFDGTTHVDDDHDDDMLDASYLKSRARACASCGFGEDDEDVADFGSCLTCQSGDVLLVVHSGGCLGICVDAEAAPALSASYGLATLADSECEAARPCYDDDAVLALAADGFVPVFLDDDGSYSYSYSGDCEDFRGMAQMRSESTKNLLVDQCRGYDFDGIYGLDVRFIFTASAGTYVGASVADACEIDDPYWGTTACHFCDANDGEPDAEGRLTIEWDSYEKTAIAARTRVDTK